jgi:predicted metal-binding membrane protein
VPLASGVALLVAAGLELAPWKQRHLRFCRTSPACRAAAPGRAGAWKHGIRLGVHCASCCSSFILILLVLGVMDLAVMAAVAAAITIERLAPRPDRIARAFGLATIAGALVAIARALRASGVLACLPLF